MQYSLVILYLMRDVVLGGKNQHKNKISTSEMRMLHWMCGKTRHGRIRNDNIREKVGVVRLIDIEKPIKTIKRNY